MARQRQRKTVEELYGNKFDATKSPVTTITNSALKNGRATERDYGYIINSNTPYSNLGAVPPPSESNLGTGMPASGGKETSRRKSARLSTKAIGEKYNKEKESIENSKEFNMKMRTSRGGVSGSGGAVSPIAANMYDNKLYANCNGVRYKDSHGKGDGMQQFEHHPHHHRNNNNINNERSVRHDDDKDDDTEEFFQLIRQTVESAIGKSISELLNRNFRELTSKVDRFSAELKNTNALLSKMETEMKNKIVHYGEENSRHFRYLCMKSEYDKMFYQHQTMISAVTPPITNVVPKPHNVEKRKSLPKINIPNEQQEQQQHQHQQQQHQHQQQHPQQHPQQQPQHVSEKPNISTTCSTCRGHKQKPPSNEAKESHKPSSGDISQRSSEIGMREVLEHIQKFCNQVKSSDFKCDLTVPGGNDLMINNEIFVDEFEGLSDVSSDGMTPRSEQSVHKYGGSTMRGSIRDGNNGGGDA